MYYSQGDAGSLFVTSNMIGFMVEILLVDDVL